MPFSFAKTIYKVFTQQYIPTNPLMKCAFHCILAFYAILSNAQILDWDNPTKPFDTRKKLYNTIRVEWRTVSDVRSYCSKLNSDRGYGPIKFPIVACSTQDGNVCVIVTGNETSMHTLGHEVRHCFQGEWHVPTTK